MSALTEFLLARIEEDERVARIAAAGPGCGFGNHELAVVINPPRGTVEVAPGRVLAECAAKRRIVTRYVRCTALVGKHPSARATEQALRPILEDLALSYADHPDYREEWRP